MLKLAFGVLSILLLSTSSVSACDQCDEDKQGSSSSHDVWITDMDEAQKLARKEGKDIFMFFTGSDWCGWCVKLEKEVLSKQEFIDFASSKFVLVELDFPAKDDIISEEQRAHNEIWKEKFSHSGYPATYLTTASVERYGKIGGYWAGGPAVYNNKLENLLEAKHEVERLLFKAEQSSGIERAKLLDEAMSIDGAIIESRKAFIDELISLAKDRDHEIYVKYRDIKGDNELIEKLTALRSVDDGAEAALNSALSLFHEYSYLKDGNGLSRLITVLSGAFIKVGAYDKGMSFFDDLVADKSYSVKARQRSMINKAYIMGANGELDQAKGLIDSAVDMAPDLISSGLKDSMLYHLNKVSKSVED
ncbi:thioredoxin family protein [Porticoccaceae bacterium LTM1]|nr:thioredoxin family protein [Porticoccaceae bacterium LTM1]